MSGREPLVRGRILLGRDLKPFTNATVYVRLENVSRADVSSSTAAEKVLTEVSHRAGQEEEVSFNLYGEPPDEGSDYSVRVHVDVDGDGEVSVGDYITTESYPVLTYDHPNHVDVHVEEVT